MEERRILIFPYKMKSTTGGRFFADEAKPAGHPSSCLLSGLQCRRMSSLKGTIRVSGAMGSSHTLDGGERFTTEFAGVAFLFCSFIQFVFPFEGTIRMSSATLTSQAGNA